MESKTYRDLNLRKYVLKKPGNIYCIPSYALSTREQVSQKSKLWFACFRVPQEEGMEGSVEAAVDQRRCNRWPALGVGIGFKYEIVGTKYQVLGRTY